MKRALAATAASLFAAGAIAAEEEMSHLGASSKFNADWKFLTYLYELGVETTDKWLVENFDKIGEESTLDMVKAYS